MSFTVVFFINSVLFGVGLAMDAFSISLVNGFCEPQMKKSRMSLIAGTFSLFQFLMPLIGWICVQTIATVFVSFQRIIPWIAFALLLIIGGKMIIESIQTKNTKEQNNSASPIEQPETLCNSDRNPENKKLGLGALILQGIATSIDALSVGFTISEASIAEAITESLIIGAVTFVICWVGIYFGKTVGTKLSNKASILGGLILIGIGTEILISGMMG